MRKEIFHRDKNIEHIILFFRTLLTGCLGSLMLEEYGWHTPFYCIGKSFVQYVQRIKKLIGLRKWINIYIFFCISSKKFDK